LSRKGKANFSSLILISFFLIICIYSNYYWGADLPAILLIFALIIVMAGILIGSKFAFHATFFSGGSIILFTFLESVGVIHPNRIRDIEKIHMGDSIVYVIILGMISVVSWLFNRESERALKRARASEYALNKQKEHLEIVVEKRTRQLKQAQVKEMENLYRLAEFGRMASGLFHDFASPLNLISLNLDRLNDENAGIKRHEMKILVERAVAGTKLLEKFVLTARKQMQNQEVFQRFSLAYEISQIIEILSYRIKKEHVRVTVTAENGIETFGNPIKFNHIMTNLIVNALDSYDDEITSDNRIEILLQKTDGQARISVHDWGIGIPASNIAHVFEPFFTTKNIYKGCGIGLAICQNIICKDFQGQIQAESNIKTGTVFTITFPIRRSLNGKNRSKP
jgi:C4-dicarboxylate-specific signal transduction histidine kinase